MIDLAPFRARVTAAVNTNQLLDYASDVTALCDEVERLKRGIDAAEEFYGGLYALEHHIPSWTADTPRTVGRERATAERMLGYIHQAMA